MTARDATTRDDMENDIISRIQAADQAKKKALRGLYKALGYSSPKDLADAILDAEATTAAPAERKGAAEGKKTTTTTVAATAAERIKATAAGKRPRISEETKRAIADALRAGEAGSRLTEQFGVSYGVIHQIKAKAGLVSKKKAGRKKA